MPDREDWESTDGIEALPEKRGTLWLITVGPAIWALYFTLSYVTVALWCAKIAGRSGSLGGARIAVATYTLTALVGISIAAWRGYRMTRLNAQAPPHDKATPGDRHRFLGLSTLLLCTLSFVATIYVALGVVFIGSCR